MANLLLTSVPSPQYPSTTLLKGRPEKVTPYQTVPEFTMPEVPENRTPSGPVKRVEEAPKATDSMTLDEILPGDNTKKSKAPAAQPRQRSVTTAPEFNEKNQRSQKVLDFHTI